MLSQLTYLTNDGYDLGQSAIIWIFHKASLIIRTMDLDFITDPELAPRPRDEVCITEMALKPYPDGQRIVVEIGMTPFAPADRPSLEITMTSADGFDVSSISVIEAMHNRLRLTLHLREADPVGHYTLRADLYYEPGHIQHSLSQPLTLTPGTLNKE